MLPPARRPARWITRQETQLPRRAILGSLGRPVHSHPQRGQAVASRPQSTQSTGTVFRGQSACGPQVYAPVLSGQAVLIDPFGTVVAAGNSFGQTSGIGTSQGQYLLQPGPGLPGLSGGGPVPGLNYTISYDTSITLTAPQTWGPSTQDGCSVSGQTLHCVVVTPYSYIPGTKGGLTPG